MNPSTTPIFKMDVTVKSGVLYDLGNFLALSRQSEELGISYPRIYISSLNTDPVDGKAQSVFVPEPPMIYEADDSNGHNYTLNQETLKGRVKVNAFIDKELSKIGFTVIESPANHTNVTFSIIFAGTKLNEVH